MERYNFFVPIRIVVKRMEPEDEEHAQDAYHKWSPWVGRHNAKLPCEECGAGPHKRADEKMKVRRGHALASQLGPALCLILDEYYFMSPAFINSLYCTDEMNEGIVS